MGDINKSEDIINILLEYVKINFNRFGHQEPNWWWNHNYGSEGSSSWSPFVEACFIEEFKKYPNYEVFCCVEDSTQLKKYMGASYHNFNRDRSDINIRVNGSYFLSLEHSEDGRPSNRQKDRIIEEIDKLKKILGGFKVLISRPQPFDRWKNREGYSQSIVDFKQEIQNQLKDDNGKWLIILIAPQPDNHPTEIIFHCYEWNGKELSDFDPDHTKYVIPIKVINGKWEKR